MGFLLATDDQKSLHKITSFCGCYLLQMRSVDVKVSCLHPSISLYWIVWHGVEREIYWLKGWHGLLSPNDCSSHHLYDGGKQKAEAINIQDIPWHKTYRWTAMWRQNGILGYHCIYFSNIILNSNTIFTIYYLHFLYIYFFSH